MYEFLWFATGYAAAGLTVLSILFIFGMTDDEADALEADTTKDTRKKDE